MLNHTVTGQLREELNGNQIDTIQAIPQIIADLKDGKISIFELVRSAKSEDYWSHIQVARLMAILLHDPTALNAFHKELNHKIEDLIQICVDKEYVQKSLNRKDGERRFLKLLQERTEMLKGAKSLLSGSDFHSCLKQYKSLVSHVENLWESACQAYKSKNFPISAFTSILVFSQV